MKRKKIVITISLLIISFGLFLLSYNYFMEQKLAVYNSMNLQLYSLEGQEEEDLSVQVEVNDIEGEEEPVPEVSGREYIATLKIPAISLNLGLVSPDSPYNNVDSNITIISPSDMPDVEKGNLIIAGHSGTGYLAFFRNLYRLQIGAQASVTYNGVQYNYRLVDIYFEEKTGYVSIHRDQNKKTLTLITCTKDNDTMQTIYIFEATE